MARYFKVVTIREDKQDWMFEEYKNGRVHFGWSGPGTDLRILRQKSTLNMKDHEKVSWKYTQFLINRIEKGDRLVIQYERPLRQFLIAEVIGEYKYTIPEEDDFNHYLECKPLSTFFINVNSKIISQSLRHDITKRGHYYEIYPEGTIKELDELVQRIQNNNIQDDEDYKTLRTDQTELQNLREQTIEETYKLISKKWRSAYFEKFVASLIEKIAGMEVKRAGDSGKGWDLLVRIFDPVCNTILHDDIPVQCKNYYGPVNTRRPIEDLERCIRNSNSQLAYLFILGNLTEDYRNQILLKQEELSQELGRQIQLRVVDQEQIAELYLQHMMNES